MFNVVKASTWQPVQSFDDVHEAEAEACVCSGFAPDTIYAIEQTDKEDATRVYSLWLNGFPFRADKSFSTADLDTQPIPTIDVGEGE